MSSLSKFAANNESQDIHASLLEPAYLHSRVRSDESTHQKPVVSGLLSVDEMLSTRAAGYEVRGIVVGAAVFHVGFVGARLTSVELIPLSTALLAARGTRLLECGMRHSALGLRVSSVCDLKSRHSKTSTTWPE